MLIPENGTKERLLLDKLKQNGEKGVTYLDFIGTEITEENIGTIVNNLMTGMFIAENDEVLKVDC